MGKPNELEVQPFSCLTALRAEVLSKDGKTQTVRLIMITETHLEIYAEKAHLFGVPLARDVETSAFSGKDGEDALTLKQSIAIESLTTLELEMSAEPRARLAESGGEPLLLEFADDTGAMLFRHHMRESAVGQGAGRMGVDEPGRRAHVSDERRLQGIASLSSERKFVL